MKKTPIFLLSLALSAALTACGSSSAPEEKKEEGTTAAAEVKEENSSEEAVKASGNLNILCLVD